MSCKNPKTEISAEIGETIETLGPKIQNDQNFDLKLVGGRTLLFPFYPQRLGAKC
jgi:hypothetical protein